MFGNPCLNLVGPVRALLLALLGLCLHLPGLGQVPGLTWQQTYGGARDEEGGFAVPMNGGYLLAGQQAYLNTSFATLYFVQTNAAGDTLWTKRVPAPGTANPHVTGFVRNRAGTLLVTGLDYGTNTGFALALTSTCVPLWDRVRQLTAHAIPGATLLRTYIHKPLTDSDDNFLMVQTLSSVSSTSGYTDDAIVKVNQRNGNQLWTARVDSLLGGGHHFLYTWAKTAAGFLSIVEDDDYVTSTSRIGPLKLSPTGNVLSYSTRLMTFPYDISPYTASHDAAGNILIAGRARLTKFSPQGDTLWHTDVPQPSPNVTWDGTAVVQDRQGNYVALCNRYVPGLSGIVQMVRFRPTGQFVGDTVLSRPYSFGKSLLLAANGDFVVSGYVEFGPRGGNDLFMLQFRGFRPLASRAAAPGVAALGLYPNPVEASANATTLSVPETARTGTLFILDALGRVVRQQAVGPAQGAPSVSVAGLPPGWYVFRFCAANGQTWAGKLLRE